MLAEKPSARACQRVHERFPCCCCEQESVQPDISPGVVRNDETLVRLVPERHFDFVTKKIKPSLFEKASQNGMSVIRLRGGKEGVSDQQIKDKAIGFVTAMCQEIRSALHDGKRAFAVYDTAITDNIYHSDVCQTTCYPGAIAIKIRHQLYEIFSGTFCELELSCDQGAPNTQPKPG